MRKLKKSINKKQTTLKIQGDNATANAEQVTSIEEAIKQCNIDTDVWEVVSAEIKTYDGWRGKQEKDLSWTEGTVEGNVSDSGGINTKTLYSVRLKLKKKVSGLSLDQFREDLISDMKKISPKVKPIHVAKDLKSDNVLIVNIYDLHLNRVAWHEEVGENYDISIACEWFRQSLHELMESAKFIGFSEVWFPLGHDYFNSDSAFPYPSTTKGTPQDSDKRWQKAFRSGRQLAVEGIDFMKKSAPVEVLMIPGNHDMSVSFYLNDAIDCRFYNDKNVTVDNAPTQHKVRTWGKNLILFSHGEGDATMKRMVTGLSSNYPDLWSQSLWRYIYLGHLHKECQIKFQRDDIQGTVVHRLPSITSTDTWHHAKFFSHNQACKAMVHNREKGLIAEFTKSIIPPWARDFDKYHDGISMEKKK